MAAPGASAGTPLADPQPEPAGSNELAAGSATVYSANMSQVELGLWLRTCSADGSRTENGWTQAALRKYLEHANSEGIESVALYTLTAKPLPTGATCGWFLPELRRWVLGPQPGDKTNAELGLPDV